MTKQGKPPQKQTPRQTPEGRQLRARVRALKRTIGVNIERTRKAQNIPLRKLSRKTGFSAIKLDYWEMGRMEISLFAIVRIAAALGVPVERLFTAPTKDQGG